MIVQTGLEYEGGSVSLEGPIELTKAVLGRVRGGGKGTYHVGDPITLPPLDVSIIETIINKRQNKEKVTSEERQQFSAVYRTLKEEARMVAEKIASMLPESYRGQHREPIELNEQDIEIVD